MRFCLLSLLCLLSLGSYAQAPAASAYQRADQELNRTYQQVLQAYRADPAFLGKLKVAQQHWLQFRDAEVQARYPDADPHVAKARTQQLRLWLTGIPEDDVCTGSVKMVPSK